MGYLDVVHLVHERPVHRVRRLAHRWHGIAHLLAPRHRAHDGRIRSRARGIETLRCICEATYGGAQERRRFDK